MAYCDTCKNRESCKTICKKIEKYLQRKRFGRKNKKKGYHHGTIRRHEIPYSPEAIARLSDAIMVDLYAKY